MRVPKLTAFLLPLVIFVFVSCQKTSDVEKANIYVGKSLPMTGAQETPAVNTSATGTVDAEYNRLTKTLSYKFSFSGLTDTTTAAHIHGLAEAGVPAAVVQSFSPWPKVKAGSYTGTLLVDGVKITEADLLASRYYINVHSKAFPNGEIRGQLILSKQ
jgi:hypothetical protein